MKIGFKVLADDTKSVSKHFLFHQVLFLLTYLLFKMKNWREAQNHFHNSQIRKLYQMFFLKLTFLKKILNNILDKNEINNHISKSQNIPINMVEQIHQSENSTESDEDLDVCYSLKSNHKS
jgi:lysozyme family protein